jgi:mRNA interferase MazF
MLILILQDDRFDTDSVTVCPFTTDPTEAPLFRLNITTSATNGLARASRLMVDKITTIRRSKLGGRLGALGGR